MFSRWMFVRLRAAENALHDGRLDEAHRRLCPADMRDQRKARELRSELAQRLIARVRLHVQAGRYREALDDLDRVDAIGGATNDSRALRARAEEELRHRVGRHVQRDDALTRRTAPPRRAAGLRASRN